MLSNGQIVGLHRSPHPADTHSSYSVLKLQCHLPKYFVCLSTEYPICEDFGLFQDPCPQAT